MHKMIAIVLVGFIALACDRNYDGDDESDTTLYREHSDAIIPEAEWESFKRETELAIDANQAKLRELRNTVRAKYAHDVAILEEKNETLRRQLREFTYDDEQQWLAFRDGFSYNMNQLSDGIDGVYTKNGK